VVELLGQVAGELQVLLLVVAHRHEVGVVEQDIRGHEHRVEEQAGVDRLLLAGLVLELGHALQLPERAEAAEDPGQFGVAEHVGLDEEPAPGRVQAARDILGQAGIGVLAELGRHGGHGDRVLVHDPEIALMVVLHPTPVEDRPEVITQVRDDPSAGRRSGPRAWRAFYRSFRSFRSAQRGGRPPGHQADWASGDA